MILTFQRFIRIVPYHGACRATGDFDENHGPKTGPLKRTPPELRTWKFDEELLEDDGF